MANSDPELCPECGGELVPPTVDTPPDTLWCPDCETFYAEPVLHQDQRETR